MAQTLLAFLLEMAFTSKFEDSAAPSRPWETRRSESIDDACDLSLDDSSTEDARARLAFYEKLVDDAPVALFQLERFPDGDPATEYQFTFVGTAVRDLLGVSSRALESDPFVWLNGVRGAAGVDSREVLRRALEESASALSPLVWQGCVRLRQRDHWVEIQAQPQCGSQGRVRWTGVFTEITDHKLNLLALEGALADATEFGVKERLRAEALRDVRDELVAIQGESFAARERVVQREKASALERLARGLAHEINNPLGGVQHMLEALRAPKDSAGIDEARRAVYLDQIQAGLVRIESTVSNLLQYAQSSAPHLVTWDASAWVHEAITQVATTVSDKNIILRTSLLPKPLTLLADHQQIVRALVNVLQNAVQASPRDSTLSVNMVERNDGVEVAVRDHGAGIPAEYLHRVCDPFFTTKQQGDGNGLGLSVAQQIVAAHGGELRVETREGEGTCVTIRVPLDAHEQREATAR